MPCDASLSTDALMEYLGRNRLVSPLADMLRAMRYQENVRTLT